MKRMQLYLVRHGDAASPVVDPACGLSEVGRVEIRRLAAFLRPLCLEPVEVWHSGKDRAEQTASILTGALSGTPEVRRRSDLNPNDSPLDIAVELETCDRDILIVGHLPFLGLLASHLLARGGPPEVILFRTGTMASLERGSGDLWHLDWVIHPQILPGPGG